MTKLTEKDPIWWLMYSIFAPIITFPGYEDEGRNFKDKITIARFMKVGSGDHSEKATDAEVALYLMTASFAAPPDRDWAEIYLHTAGEAFPAVQQIMEKDKTFGKIKLTEEQQREKNRLAEWIFKQQKEALASKHIGEEKRLKA